MENKFNLKIEIDMETQKRVLNISRKETYFNHMAIPLNELPNLITELQNVLNKITLTKKIG